MDFLCMVAGENSHGLLKGRGKNMYQLKNDLYEIEIDEMGAITWLISLKTNWNIIHQPKLSLAVSLLVPTNTHRNNRAKSGKPSAILAKNDQIDLYWDSFTGDKSGVLTIHVCMSIQLSEKGLTFVLKVHNKSFYVIEELWCPCLGGIKEPAGEEKLETMVSDACGSIWGTRLGDGFPMEWGYWGTDYPTFIRSYPDRSNFYPFILVTNGNQGLYIGVHDKEPNTVHFIHQLIPGYVEGRYRTIPVDKEFNGLPAGIVLSIARMPFIQPNETAELAPVVMTFFQGDWHNGLHSYLDFRKEWFQFKPQPKWLKSIDCWLTLHMNSPEACVRYRYRDLPELMREAKGKGVQLLQLIGWARGGQDGDEPFQDTEPLLGSREELASAIKEIEDMGIRVLLMCKFKWADQSVPEWENEILPHTIKDMYGNYVQFGGYAYQTLAQEISGVSRRNGGALCHLSEDFRRFACDEFKKIVDLGCSGILYDELNNHGMTMCFDKNHHHRWGECVTKGTLKLTDEFYTLAKSVNPEFMFAAEGPKDFLAQYYPVNYIRSWGYHKPFGKFLTPELYYATCITGMDDREMLNQCLAYGYIINYEPYNFKGRITDIPQTVDYGQKVQAVRRRLWKYVWEGRFTDTVGAAVSATHKDFLYSVFLNTDNHKRAVVLVNNSKTELLEASVALEQATQFEVHFVETEETTYTDCKVSVPARSLVVLVEQ